MIGFLIDNGVPFVIRVMVNKTIKNGMVEKNVKKEVDKMKFKYKLSGLRKDEELHYATPIIGIRTDDHPIKGSGCVEISLVVVR